MSIIVLVLDPIDVSESELSKMNVKLASRLGISSLLVDLVSNDSGDVTLVTRDGKVTTNRLLLFLR